MRRLTLAGIACFALASSASAADLGPYHPYPDAYAPPPPPERKIVEHHHYYHEAPTVYREHRVYVEPRVYRPPAIYAERVYPRYAYAYSAWRPHHFFPRRHFWGHHHRHWY